jgi:hypothetical protein
MRVILASGRGLLSGWLIALTIPLLIDPHTIAAWSSAGVGDQSRVGLAVVELLGAALFAFEVPIVVGFWLLVASFILAAVIHIRHNETPWWLGAYSVAGSFLLYFTRRALVTTRIR